MVKILVVDDHKIVMKGIEQILAKTSDLRVTGEVSTGAEAVEKVSSAEFDLVLLDISLPDRNGLEVLKSIRAKKPKLPVLMISMHPEEQYAIRAIRAGAAGYINKGSAHEELVPAVRRVVMGKRYISPILAERLVEIGAGGERLPHESLSDQEFLVLRGIVSGKRINDIAKELVLSPKTVSTYKARILRKMNMKSSADLVKYAMENSLTE